MTTEELTRLINFHTAGRSRALADAFTPPESLEVRRERWRREAQERLNAKGLPRGLRVVR